MSQEKKEAKAINIYCDESGYTGGDLLETNQPYFIYAAVNFSDSQLLEIKNFIYANYQIQNDEIKGKLLVKNTPGQEVILEVFRKYSEHARIVFHDKKFVLAAKIVEYGIEPNLRSNFHFYQSGLHKFISDGLYASFITRDATAEAMFQDFQLILRGKKPITKSLFEIHNTDNPVLEWVIDIVTAKPEVVLNEITEHDSEVSKWILDLTMTSLLGLLTEWSKNGDHLSVTCDNSRVFLNNPVFDSLNQMGLSKGSTRVFGTNLGFKLEHEILNADSKSTVGLQIADLFSSTVFYCFQNRESQFSKQIIEIVLNQCLCSPESFCTGPEFLDFKEHQDKLQYYYNFMQLIYLDVVLGKLEMS